MQVINKQWLQRAREGKNVARSRQYRLSSSTLEQGDCALILGEDSESTTTFIWFDRQVRFHSFAVEQEFIDGLMNSSSLTSIGTAKHILPLKIFFPMILRAKVSLQLTTLYFKSVEWTSNDVTNLARAVELAPVLEELSMINCTFRVMSDLAKVLLAVRNMKMFSIDSSQLSLKELPCLLRSISCEDSRIILFRAHLLHPGVANQIKSQIYRRMLWRRLFPALEKKRELKKALFSSYVFTGYFGEPLKNYVSQVIKNLNYDDALSGLRLDLSRFA